MLKQNKKEEYPPPIRVQVGDLFPVSELLIQDGTYLKLKTLKSHWIALFFYPEDDSPTCTKQACNLRDSYEMLAKKNIYTLGVSPDDEKKHKRFIEKYQLPFPLVVDQDHALAKRLGIFGLKKFMGRVYEGIHRTTIILNKDLKIHAIIYPVVSGKHGEQIMNVLHHE
ncbi:MAG: peroxiredoxin [Saprospiraceae bacterium]|nr:peroxiredoxin [Saprospiraceae bacterium]